MGRSGATAQSTAGKTRCITSTLPASDVLRHFRCESDQRRGYPQLLLLAVEKRRCRRTNIVRPKTGRHSGYLLPSGTV